MTTQKQKVWVYIYHKKRVSKWDIEKYFREQLPRYVISAESVGRYLRSLCEETEAALLAGIEPSRPCYLVDKKNRIYSVKDDMF